MSGIWLPDERPKEHAADAVIMAYKARHPDCGHVRALAVDRRNGSLDEFVSLGLTGLLLSREPAEEAKAAFVECDVCRPPTQDGMGL